MKSTASEPIEPPDDRFRLGGKLIATCDKHTFTLRGFERVPERMACVDVRLRVSATINDDMGKEDDCTCARIKEPEHQLARGHSVVITKTVLAPRIRSIRDQPTDVDARHSRTTSHRSRALDQIERFSWRINCRKAERHVGSHKVPRRIEAVAEEFLKNFVTPRVASDSADSMRHDVCRFTAHDWVFVRAVGLRKKYKWTLHRNRKPLGTRDPNETSPSVDVGETVSTARIE